MSGIGELLLRMIVSLAVVLALVAVAYSFARRRNGVGRTRLATLRSRPAAVNRLDVEARIGLARGSAAVAVRFGDRIVLVGVNDGAPSSVLAELPATEWDVDPDADLDADHDLTLTSIGRPNGAGPNASTTAPFDPDGLVSQRPTFVEALRTATSRRS